MNSQARPAVLDATVRRDLGRRLTRLAGASVAEIVASASANDDVAQGRARRIGLTGPPGAGKSTLAGALAVVRSSRARLGVLAIDPSSPRSGGAILGDRIRIDEIEATRDLYVRSIASRGASDGLADNLPELIAAMDEVGFDEILLETVGVGQAEHAIRNQVDTLVLVIPPESGDLVQAMKAGVMELADIYVVHKTDLPGAAKTAADISRVLHLAQPGNAGWKPRVLQTASRDGSSIDALSSQIDKHQDWLAQSDSRQSMQISRARCRLRSLLQRHVIETIDRLPDSYFDAALAAQFGAALEKMHTAQPSDATHSR